MKNIKEELLRAECWYVGDSSLGRTSSKWWNMPSDLPYRAAKRIEELEDLSSIIHFVQVADLTDEDMVLFLLKMLKDRNEA